VYLGIDVGTSGVKAVLVNETGAMVATRRRKTFARSWFSEVTERIVTRQPGSGRHEPLENIVTRHIWRLCRIQTPLDVREESS